MTISLNNKDVTLQKGRVTPKVYWPRGQGQETSGISRKVLYFRAPRDQTPGEAGKAYPGATGCAAGRAAGHVPTGGYDRQARADT
jgi:hypothetical protein